MYQSVNLGDEIREVLRGDVIFVEAGLKHKFFAVEQQLVLLVVFGPAETN